MGTTKLRPVGGMAAVCLGLIVSACSRSEARTAVAAPTDAGGLGRIDGSRVGGSGDGGLEGGGSENGDLRAVCVAQGSGSLRGRVTGMILSPSNPDPLVVDGVLPGKLMFAGVRRSGFGADAETGRLTLMGPDNRTEQFLVPMRRQVVVPLPSPDVAGLKVTFRGAQAERVAYVRVFLFDPQVGRSVLLKPRAPCVDGITRLGVSVRRVVRARRARLYVVGHASDGRVIASDTIGDVEQLLGEPREWAVSIDAQTTRLTFGALRELDGIIEVLVVSSEIPRRVLSRHRGVPPKAIRLQAISSTVLVWRRDRCEAYAVADHGSQDAVAASAPEQTWKVGEVELRPHEPPSGAQFDRVHVTHGGALGLSYGAAPWNATYSFHEGGAQIRRLSGLPVAIRLTDQFNTELLECDWRDGDPVGGSLRSQGRVVFERLCFQDDWELDVALQPLALRIVGNGLRTPIRETVTTFPWRTCWLKPGRYTLFVEGRPHWSATYHVDLTEGGEHKMPCRLLLAPVFEATLQAAGQAIVRSSTGSAALARRGVPFSLIGSPGCAQLEVAVRELGSDRASYRATLAAGAPAELSSRGR